MMCRAHEGLDVGCQGGNGALVLPDGSHHVSLLHHLHILRLQSILFLCFLADLQFSWPSFAVHADGAAAACLQIKK